MKPGFFAILTLSIGIVAIATAFPDRTVKAAAPTNPAEKRIALIIANSIYANAPDLTNPKNDGALMESTLIGLGFDVQILYDASQKQMRRAMRDFGRTLRGDDAVGLFYYAGHAVQVNGENYLIPASADISDETEVEIEAVGVNAFLQTMKRAKSRINIVILDACRNNPFKGASRSGIRGLARVSAPRGTFIAYATAPGQVALDGDQANSPYTAALARKMQRPGLPIEVVFKQTRIEVLEVTEDTQTPWETSSITGDFYFSGRGTPPPVQEQKSVRAGTNAASSSTPRSAGNTQLELTFWNSIKETENKAMFEAYLKRYPDGVFADLARIRIVEIERAPVESQTASISGQANNRNIQYLIPDSSRRNLQWSELQPYDCNQLWIARNEIFHRNGYCFRSARGRRQFGNAGCRTQSQDIVSSLEKTNARLIRDMEAQKQCRR